MLTLKEVLKGTSPTDLHDSHALPYSDANLHLEVMPSATTAQGAILRGTAKQHGVQLHVQRDQHGARLRTAGTWYFIAMAEKDALHIATGDGADSVEILSEHDGLVVIETGAGNDIIQGHSPGPGNVVVNAGTGDDHVELRGGGQATVYGGAGDDVLITDMQHATIFTGTGSDTVKALGTAVIDATIGSNHVECIPDRDHVYSNPQTRITSIAPSTGPSSPVRAHPGYQSILVSGDASYRELVAFNLALLVATATGRAMLESLDASNARITIENIPELDNGYFRGEPSQGDPAIRHSQHGDKVLEGRIGFNPLARKTDTPAVVILYHELCHAWNSVNGTVLPDHENQVTGLPTPDSFDFDGDPSTPANNTNPDPFNENALRRELGLPRRNVY
ncbi:M91 family zinc metallopeptidase [Pseudomonas sp. microsymbiont 2]